MKKVFIGLLILAAGTASYFYFFNPRTCNKPGQLSLNKEVIVGKWKTVTIEPVSDTTQQIFSYDFTKEGKVSRAINDTVKADTLYYNWNGNAVLVLKKAITDSSGNELIVNTLTADTLQFQSPQKTTVTLVKLKDK